MRYIVYCKIPKWPREVVGEYDKVSQAEAHMRDELELMRDNDMKAYDRIKSHGAIEWAGGRMWVEAQP